MPRTRGEGRDRTIGAPGFELPERLVGDKAYDSDPPDEDLAVLGIELIAPPLRNRRLQTQDGRPLRCYRRRWKTERMHT